MTDDDKSLGDDATLGGENAERDIDAQSLGDQSTHGDHSQMDSVGDSSSLGDQLTFGGDGTGEVLDDGMQVVDLEERYTIEGELGKGGMGEVLLATDTRLNRKVAIKRILGKSVRSGKAYQRFLNGAQAIAGLNHPNIVQLYDFGRASDGPFMILEYVSGGSLLDRCRQGPIPLEEAIDITCQLCDGLAKAHDAGIIHRDIKPANVLMTEDGIPKLTDFDLAKEQLADTGMTMAGAVLGTLDFMPPEQRQDATQADARSDLWSLAATLYQMVTGESPKVIRIKKVPKQLQDFLDKALEESKQDRYQTAREIKDPLIEILGTNIKPGNELNRLGIGQCPECKTENDVSRKFCAECATPLRLTCLECEASIPVWERICGECGGKQDDLRVAAERYKEAIRHRGAFDYKSAIESMESIQESALNDEMASFNREIKTDHMESKQLHKFIAEKVALRKFDGLLDAVERAIKLRGDRDDLRKLKSQLTRREKKITSRRNEVFGNAKQLLALGEAVEAHSQVRKIKTKHLRKEDVEFRKQLKEIIAAEKPIVEFMNSFNALGATTKNSEIAQMFVASDSYLKLNPKNKDIRKLRDKLLSVICASPETYVRFKILTGIWNQQNPDYLATLPLAIQSELDDSLVATGSVFWKGSSEIFQFGVTVKIDRQEILKKGSFNKGFEVPFRLAAGDHTISVKIKALGQSVRHYHLRAEPGRHYKVSLLYPSSLNNFKKKCDIEVR